MALVLVLTPCVAIGTIAWLGFSRAVKQTDRVSNEVLAEGLVVLDVQVELRRLEAEADLRASTDANASVVGLEAIMSAIEDGLSEARAFDEPAERDIARRVEQHWWVAREILAAWLIEPAGHPPTPGLDALHVPIDAAIGELYALDGSIHEDLQRTMIANSARARRGQNALMVAVAAAVLLTAWMARRLRLAAYRPLQQLESGLRDLSTDGLQHHIEVTGDSEFHAVADALNGMTDRIARQIDELEELDRLKAEFVATASHELRTPLTNVLGQLELLGDGEYGELADDQARSVRIMDRNGRRLLSLIEDILTLSRMESTGLGLRLVATDLRKLTAGIEELVAPAAGSRPVRLRFDIGTDLGTLDVDAPQLERALVNLLSNAIKFTPADGSVALRAERTEHSVIFTVSDTGIGIPVDEQDRLFTRFFRSSLARDMAIQGPGLGLVIAKTIVEEHGGTLHVVSAEGEGTVVTATLPIRPIFVDGKPQPGLSDVSAGTPSPRHGDVGRPGSRPAAIRPAA
ncbi:MAG: hypothetical protein QOE13_3377 [Gaiellaceae bacterium]|nr:hypothetical protein [Gaiellaceae bacterium]